MRTNSSRVPPPPAVCRTCKDSFSSRNALFSHLRKTLHYLRSTVRSVLCPIVRSKASRQKVGTGTAFKDYNYCEFRYQLSRKSPESESWGCADTTSGMSLVDESVLEAGATAYKRVKSSPVHVKGIGDEMYLSNESVVLNLFLPDATNSRLAKITREFHVVQDMACGLLLGNDIIEPEGIVIDLTKKRMRISSCINMVCQLRVRRRQQTNRVVVRCAQTTVLRSEYYDYPAIPIRFPKLENKEYPFKVYPNQAGLPEGCYIFTTKISGDCVRIWVRNYSGKDVVIPKDYKLGYIELPEPPQYTPVKLVDVVQCHFRQAAEPESPRSSTVKDEVDAATSVNATSSRRVPKKTSSPSESAFTVAPKCARCRPPFLRTFVPPSPVHSLVSLHRSPFFFYQCPLFSRPLPWQPLVSISYDCQNILSFPPKPGWR